MQPPKILPPHYFIAAVATIISFRWLVPESAWSTGLSDAGLHWLGLLPMLVGLLIAIAASNHFKKVDTNIIPLTRSTTLVTSGMFGYSRNPMYLGMLLFLSGLCLLVKRPEGLSVVVVFFLIIRQWFVLREEQLLTDTFGDDYTRYTGQVRRWV